MKKVVLKEGRDRSVLRRHPWIFSGAIESISEIEPGELLPVYSADGTFLAQAYFNPNNSLAGRILSFTQENIIDSLAKRLALAKSVRDRLIDSKETNAFRLVNGEGDGISGFIVDLYNRHLVIQVHTQGIERLKKELVSMLVDLTGAETVFEKSLSAARTEEGMDPNEGDLIGVTPQLVQVRENGIQFHVAIPSGQKTGFFLDQRGMREEIRKISLGRSVLNCFAYTGGFSLYALKGGAHRAISIDSCSRACDLAKKNSLLNSIEGHTVIQSNVWDYLESEPITADLVILDPPAFAKKRGHLDQAFKGYESLNMLALSKMAPQSLLLTCSCSYFMDGELFQKAIFQAAQRAGRFVRIIGRHKAAFDHPIALTHPEGNYLKSLLLFVE